MTTNEDRTRLIQDSLLGLTTWLHELDAFLYPVTDSLLLYFHKPLVISFWRLDGGRPQLSFRSSMSRPDILDESTAILVAEQGTLPGMPYAVLVEEGTPQGLQPLDDATRQAARLLTPRKRPSTESSLFKKMLLAALECANPATLTEKTGDLVSEVQEDGSDDPVEPSLRALFDTLLTVGAPIESEHQADSPHLGEPFDIAALLSRRRALEQGGGTGLGARILLFKCQESSLSRSARSGSLAAEYGNELLSVGERPFSPIQVPEIWNCFTLGTIAIQGPSSGPRSAQIRTDQGEAWSGWSTLFSRDRGYRLLVPIHVGGVPWTVLMRRGSAPGRSDWLESYHFYRELVPRLATALRVGAKKVYLDALGRALSSELERRPTAFAGSEFVTQVNRRWRQLAERLPFELPRLRLRADEEEGIEGNELRLPSGRRLAIELDQGFFKPILRYDPLAPTDIVEACRRAVDEFARTESSIQLRTIATATHALGLPIDELKRLTGSVEPHGLREAINLRLGRLKALEIFSNYLLSPSKRRDRIWKSKSIRLADLFSWLEQRVAEILSLYADPDLGEQAWRVAGRLLKAGFRVEVDASLAPDLLVGWFTEQAEVAMDGLMANAVKFNDLDQPGLALWVGAGGYGEAGEAKGIFLKITNRSARSPEELRDLVRNLNQGADPRYVGVSLLAMANQACGLLPPRWEVDQEDRMVVVLQIGRLIE